MSATITMTANGLRLLEAVNFDRYIAASIISTRDDWQEILDSIPAADLRRNLAGAVWAIRTALALAADYARAICEGRE